MIYILCVILRYGVETYHPDRFKNDLLPLLLIVTTAASPRDAGVLPTTPSPPVVP